MGNRIRRLKGPAAAAAGHSHATQCVGLGDAGACAAAVTGGFTIVELLVVISILALLMAIVAPSMRKIRELGLRTRCGSNMHQWSNALGAYAANNAMYFPENTSNPARHISWCSGNVGEFWKTYLLQWDKKNIQAGYDILYCPTQLWHRDEVALRDLFGLCGYFYMPHRDNTPWNTMDYTPAGREWVTKKRFGQNPRTPIMADMKQYAGWIPGWYMAHGTPISSHRQPTGEPYGGNYLFEDGGIRWYDTDDIGVGGTIGGWVCFYDVPLP